MRYRGFYIDECEMSGVVREDGEKEVECDGIMFTIYADSDYSYEIDNFIGGYGFEIDQNQESIEDFVRSYIDSEYVEYKEMQFRLILEKDYNSYKYDVLNSDYFSDAWETADEIASIQRIYEYLKDSNDIPIEDMEYIISLNRPLENLSCRLKLNEKQFAEDVNLAVKSMISNQDCSYGYATDYESSDEIVIDKVADGQTPEMDGGMDMH